MNTRLSETEKSETQLKDTITLLNKDLLSVKNLIQEKEDKLKNLQSFVDSSKELLKNTEDSKKGEGEKLLVQIEELQKEVANVKQEKFKELEESNKKIAEVIKEKDEVSKSYENSLLDLQSLKTQIDSAKSTENKRRRCEEM